MSVQTSVLRPLRPSLCVLVALHCGDFLAAGHSIPQPFLPVSTRPGYCAAQTSSCVPTEYKGRVEEVVLGLCYF